MRLCSVVLGGFDHGGPSIFINFFRWSNHDKLLSGHRSPIWIQIRPLSHVASWSQICKLATSHHTQRTLTGFSKLDRASCLRFRWTCGTSWWILSVVGLELLVFCVLNLITIFVSHASYLKLLYGKLACKTRCAPALNRFLLFWSRTLKAVGHWTLYSLVTSHHRNCHMSKFRAQGFESTPGWRQTIIYCLWDLRGKANPKPLNSLSQANSL